MSESKGPSTRTIELAAHDVDARSVATATPAPSSTAVDSSTSGSSSEDEGEGTSSDDESSSGASVGNVLSLAASIITDEVYMQFILHEMGQPVSELVKDVGRIAIMQATTGTRIRFANHNAIACLCLRSDKNHAWHSRMTCTGNSDRSWKDFDSLNGSDITRFTANFGTTITFPLLAEMYAAEIDHDAVERRAGQLTRLVIKGWVSKMSDARFVSSARHGEAIQKVSLLDALEFSSTADIAGTGFLLERKSIAKRAAKIVTCDQISQEFGGPRVPVISADNGHSQVVVQWTEIGDYQDALMPKPLINVLYLAIDMVYDVVVTLASGKSSRLRNLRTSVDIAVEDLPEVISYIEQELKRASWSELNEHASALHIIDAESCLILEIRAATTICSFLAKVLTGLMDPTGFVGLRESKDVKEAFQLLQMRARMFPLNPLVIRLGLLAIRLIEATVMRGHKNHPRCLVHLSMKEARTFFMAQLQ